MASVVYSFVVSLTTSIIVDRPACWFAAGVWVCLVLQGGILFFTRVEGPILLQNVTGFDNRAGVAAGAPGRKGNVTLPGSSLSRGGAVAALGSTTRERSALIVRSSAFWSNSAKEGGVFFVGESGNLYMSGVLAWNNTALYKGGVASCVECDSIATQLDS